MPTPSLILVPARFKTGKLYTPVATTSGGVVLGASGDFNVTRATTATRVNASGLVESVASGIPRLDYPLGGGCPALLVEAAATNLALHSRDLSNVVWVKTSITAAKNAVGADGTASGATTLTATAVSGTVLQALVNVSQSRVFSAYIRRVTGTGAIQLTTNGGTNWTTVTITSGYTQVACAAQTVLNGSVGIRMAVSGDVIEVDFTQGEVGPVATSPIATTAGTGSRNADVITLSGAVSGCIGQTEGTIYAEVDFRSPTNAGAIIQLDSGDSTNRVFIGAGATINIGCISGGSSYTLPVTGSYLTGVNKIAVVYGSSNFTAYLNGVQIGSATPTAGTFPTNLLTQFNVGSRISAGVRGAFLNDRIRSLALYTTRLTNAELAALTTP
jgi:hypothetical protein